MAFFTWDQKYSVGVRELDTQHKQLINILNELYEAMQAQKDKAVIGKIISELASYTKIHFSTEEKYMEKYNYSDLASQKREHEKFIEKVKIFQQDFESGKLALSINVASFVKEWLANHILISDKKYGPFLNSKGVS